MPTAISYCNTAIPAASKRAPLPYQPGTWRRRILTAAFPPEGTPRRSHDEEAQDVPTESDLYTRICWSRLANPSLVRVLLSLPKGYDALRQFYHETFEANTVAFGAEAVQLQLENARLRAQPASPDARMPHGTLEPRWVGSARIAQAGGASPVCRPL